jgi:hypothetical protein
VAKKKITEDQKIAKNPIKKDIDKGDVDIYGRNYDVIEAPIIATEFETLGDCNYEFGRIRIRQDIPKNTKGRVLIHEMSHAALYENGLNELYTREQVEGICNFVCHMYYNVIPRNIDLIKSCE